VLQWKCGSLWIAFSWRFNINDDNYFKDVCFFESPNWMYYFCHRLFCVYFMTVDDVCIRFRLSRWMKTHQTSFVATHLIIPIQRLRSCGYQTAWVASYLFSRLILSHRITQFCQTGKLIIIYYFYLPYLFIRNFKIIFHKISIIYNILYEVNDKNKFNDWRVKWSVTGWPKRGIYSP